MNKFYPLLLAIVLTSLTSAVVAAPEPISYRFFSAKYSLYSSIMNGFPADIDGHAISLDLSIDATPYIAIAANYTTGKAQVTSMDTTSNADLDSYSFGAVIHLPINDHTDLVVGTRFINGNVKVDGPLTGSEDINGGMSSIGVRSRVSDWVELDGYVQKNSITDESSISLVTSASYFVNNRFTINLGYAIDSDGDAFSLGTTKYF